MLSKARNMGKLAAGMRGSRRLALPKRAISPAKSASVCVAPVVTLAGMREARVGWAGVDETCVRRCFVQGRTCEGDGRWAEALCWYTVAHELEPNAFGPYLALANAEERLGLLNHAKSDLSCAIRLRHSPPLAATVLNCSMTNTAQRNLKEFSQEQLGIDEYVWI